MIKIPEKMSPVASLLVDTTGLISFRRKIKAYKILNLN